MSDLRDYLLDAIATARRLNVSVCLPVEVAETLLGPERVGEVDELKFGSGEYTTSEMRAWLSSETSMLHGTDMAHALLAALERLGRLEAAAREVVSIGGRDVLLGSVGLLMEALVTAKDASGA